MMERRRGAEVERLENGEVLAAAAVLAIMAFSMGLCVGVIL